MFTYCTCEKSKRCKGSVMTTIPFWWKNKDDCWVPLCHHFRNHPYLSVSLVYIPHRCLLEKRGKFGCVVVPKMSGHRHVQQSCDLQIRIIYIYVIKLYVYLFWMFSEVLHHKLSQCLLFWFQRCCTWTNWTCLCLGDPMSDEWERWVKQIPWNIYLSTDLYPSLHGVLRFGYATKGTPEHHTRRHTTRGHNQSPRNVRAVARSGHATRLVALDLDRSCESFA